MNLFQWCRSSVRSRKPPHIIESSQQRSTSLRSRKGNTLIPEASTEHRSAAAFDGAEPQSAICAAVLDYLNTRRAKRGGAPLQLTPSLDVFSVGLIDSLSLTELVAHVESRAAAEIDFFQVDPENLGTLGGLIKELERARV